MGIVGVCWLVIAIATGVPTGWPEGADVQTRDDGTPIDLSTKTLRRDFFLTDSEGNRIIDGMAGLWCTSLGFNEKELIEAATAQMHRLPFYHVFGGKGHEGAIELAEKLKAAAGSGDTFEETAREWLGLKRPNWSEAHFEREQRNVESQALDDAPEWSPDEAEMVDLEEQDIEARVCALNAVADRLYGCWIEGLKP